MIGLFIGKRRDDKPKQTQTNEQQQRDHKWNENEDGMDRAQLQMKDETGVQRAETKSPGLALLGRFEDAREND